VYWNDYYYGHGKTLHCSVSVYYETGGDFIFSSVYSGYTTPRIFTATSSGNVIIRVEPSSGYTGTYAVMYGEIKPLAIGTAPPGAITAGEVKLYSFSIDANTVYEVSWEDSGDRAGSSSYNGDIKVTAYRESIGSNALFYAENSGYATPQTVSHTSDAVIYLKVDGVSAGTYSIKYRQWTPPGTLNITVGFNLGSITIAGSNGTNIIRKISGSPTSLQLSAAGYTDVIWYVDGSTSGISSNTLTINAVDYAAQRHSVTFTGYKSGALFSQAIPFTVTD
jgi:hypothetical protein